MKKPHQAADNKESFLFSYSWHAVRKVRNKTNEYVIKGNMMRKLETANSNRSQSKVFDINLLTREPFELSRLEGFVDGDDDIFDVLANQRQEQSQL